MTKRLTGRDNKRDEKQVAQTETEHSARPVLTVSIGLEGILDLFQFLVGLDNL